MSELHSEFRNFLDEVKVIGREFLEPADIVLEAAPLMYQRMSRFRELLTPDLVHGCDEHYARNLIHCEPDDSMSLFCMVWGPGQWTPVHDHGAWGVVGVVSGALQERNYIRTDPCRRDDSGIELKRGGVSVLGHGTVTTFIPNPDHIHRAGVPRDWDKTVTLHLYGREMNGYNVYDLELGRRSRVDIGAD
jgi:predicted metal-dependent enzyme (double-stranded beta helix superfamily)